MSAIFGVIRWDGEDVDPMVIDAMKTSLASRSPDGFCTWQGNGVVLGHGMLDPRGLGAPLEQLAQFGSSVLTADTRLSNRVELAERLSIAPQESDELLVLSAYAKWGAECVNHLEGDFAFAIWDEQRRSVFCACDHMGARPLHFVSRDDYFAFASTPEALTVFPEIGRRPNEEFVASILVPVDWNYELRSTWQESVYVLRSAERAVVTKKSMVIDRYWDLEITPDVKLVDDNEYIECFWEVFDRALRNRTDGDAVSLMLSGGLDSASIVASMIRQELTLDSCSVASNDEQEVETRFIRILQEQPGIRNRCETITIHDDAKWYTSLKRQLLSNSHPVENSVPLPSLVAQMASHHSRVLLHGGAGDVTQTWDSSLPIHYLRSGRLVRAFSEMFAQHQNNTYLRHRSLLDIVLRNLVHAFVPGSVVFKRSRPKSAIDLGEVINPAFADRLQLLDKCRAKHQTGERRVAGQNRTADGERVMSLIQSGNIGIDRVAGLHGMISRDVWADRSVVHFYTSLPLEVRTRYGWTKYLARKASARYLPSEICWRIDKDHLGWSLIDNIFFRKVSLTQEQLLMLEEVLLPFVAKPFFKRLTSSNMLSEQDQEWIYILISLGAWLSLSEMRSPISKG